MLSKSQEIKVQVSEQKPLLVAAAPLIKKGKSFYMAFAPDNSFIVTGHDKMIRIFNAQGEFLKEIPMRYWDKDEIRGVSIDADGKSIIVTNTANCIQKWSIESGSLVDRHVLEKTNLNLPHLLKFAGNANLKIERSNSVNFFCLSITPRDVFLIPRPTIKSIGSFVEAVQINSKVKLERFDDNVCDEWNTHDISSNNLLAAGVSKTIFIFDISKKGKKLQKTLDGHLGRITSVVFSSDNRLIISGSDDKTIRVWDVETGNLLKVLNAHSEGVLSVAISPNGQHLASGDVGGNMLIWDFSKLMQSLKPSSVDENTVTENRLLEFFSAVLNDPNLFSIKLLSKMFAEVQNLEEFKLPYTLASIELRQNAEHKKAIKEAIFTCLEKLASTCPSEKHNKSNKEGSRYVAQYMLALDLVRDKDLIDKGDRYYLANLAEESRTFSDERFVSLQRGIQALKERINSAEHNIDLIAQNLNALKQALKTKAQRDCILAIAKIGVGFMAVPLVDFFARVFDLSDVAALGAVILKTDAGGWHELVQKGVAAVKENIDSVVEKAMVAAGYDPAALVDAWIDATVELAVVAPSASPSLAPSVTASLCTLAAPKLTIDLETKNTESKKVAAKAMCELDVGVKTIEDPWVDPLSVALREYAEHKGTHAAVLTILAQAQSALLSENSNLYSQQHEREKFNKKHQQSNAADPCLTVIYQRRTKLAQTRLEFFKTVIASGFSANDIKEQISSFSNRLDRSLKKSRKLGLEIYASTPQKHAYKDAITKVSEEIKRLGRKS